MGKKSLFATTTEPDQNLDQKLDRQSDPEPEREVEQTIAAASEPESATVTPTETAPSAQPDPKNKINRPTPPQPAVSHQNLSQAVTADSPQDIPGGSVFKSPLAIMAACLGFLLLMVTIASHINSGHYFIKEKNGAVEIWQGDFTPAGQNRIMILHGQEWPGAIKKFYTREEALGFARNVYLEKAQILLNDAGPLDHKRFSGYLEQTLDLLPEKLAKKNKDQLAKIEQYLAEAAVLNNSDEKIVMELAKKRFDEVQHAVMALSAAASPSSPTGPDEPAGLSRNAGVDAHAE